MLHELIVSPAGAEASAETPVRTPTTAPLAGVIAPIDGAPVEDRVGGGAGTPGVVPIVIRSVSVAVPPAVEALTARSYVPSPSCAGSMLPSLAGGSLVPEPSVTAVPPAGVSVALHEVIVSLPLGVMVAATGTTPVTAPPGWGLVIATDGGWLPLLDDGVGGGGGGAGIPHGTIN